VDYLTYFYYAGMVYIGVKNFPKAMESFQLALTVPSMMLSAVQVEAFKKYILCSLIVHGELLRLPEKLTSHVVARNVDRTCPAYVELARAYRRGVEECGKVLETHLEQFRKDRNYGLVRQAIQALVRNNILRLTKTYVTLSLTDLAHSANLGSPAEAERLLLGMIEDGQIFATINQKDGMVSFLEDPEEFDTSGQVHLLDQKIQEVIDLSGKMSAVDRDIQLNPNYITKTNPQLAGGSSDGKGGNLASQDEMMMKLAMEESMMQ